MGGRLTIALAVPVGNVTTTDTVPVMSVLGPAVTARFTVDVVGSASTCVTPVAPLVGSVREIGMRNEKVEGSSFPLARSVSPSRSFKRGLGSSSRMRRPPPPLHANSSGACGTRVSSTVPSAVAIVAVAVVVPDWTSRQTTGFESGLTVIVVVVASELDGQTSADTSSANGSSSLLIEATSTPWDELLGFRPWLERTPAT